ncbi:hypothetical protein ILUMI_17529, partial [Ignelater luminosus]
MNSIVSVRTFYGGGIKNPERKIREISGDSEDSALSDDENEASSSRNAATVYDDEDCSKHRKLYFNNYFTSVPPVAYLSKLGIDCVGTARINKLSNFKFPTEKVFQSKGRDSCVEKEAERIAKCDEFSEMCVYHFKLEVAKSLVNASTINSRKRNRPTNHFEELPKRMRIEPILSVDIQKDEMGHYTTDRWRCKMTVSTGKSRIKCSN